MKFTYLLVNFFSVLVPFLFSFHPKIQFYKKFPAFFKANTVIAILFLIWDAIFTARGVWSFSADYTLGLTIFKLPLEEILFFICIPFSSLFTFHCLQIFFKLNWNQKTEDIFVVLLALLLLALGVISFERAYTATTFISTFVVILALRYYFKVNWLSQFFSAYLFLLIPFFIVNGVLTGTGLEHPVVSYNDEENLGIRLLTIPVEDVIYGMELLLLNIFLYERFKSKRN